MSTTPTTRRTFLTAAFIVGAVPVAGSQTQPIPSTKEQPLDTSPEHLFASTYNQWIALRAQTELHPGTINSKELKAWHEVKAAFRALSRYEDNQIY